MSYDMEEERAWLEEMALRSMTIDEMIEQLHKERAESEDEEDLIWLGYSIEVLLRMKHS